MLLKFSKILLHVSLVSVVVVMTSTFFPFIGGKDYFFRFSVELALIFFILWWAFESDGDEVWHRLRGICEKPLFIAVSAFVLAVLLASLLAYDPHAAFWSNYERGEGAFEMLHYYAFFALLVFIFKKKEDWRTFFKTFLVSGSLMILYGVSADLGWASNFISKWQGGTTPDSWWQRLIGTRFQGSLGNPAYVAPFLMFSMFYAAYLWATSTFSKKWLVSFLYGGITVFFLFFFMITWTRGAFLGLVVAIFAALIYVNYMNPKYRLSILALIALLIGVGGILVHFRASGFVQGLPGGRMFDIPVGDRLLAISGIVALAVAALVSFARERKFLWWVLIVAAVSLLGAGIYARNSGILNLTDPTTSTRFWTWGSAWQGVEERPILGWGPENFSTVFDKYFDPRHFVPGQATETWFDRAHSIYFDYLAETGIVGLATYLGIFVLIYLGVLGKKMAASKNFSVTVKALLIALPVGYLVQGVAIFDVLPIYINLFAFFAFCCYCLYSRGDSAADNPARGVSLRQAVQRSDKARQ